MVVHLGVCCAGVWVTRAPRTCTIRLIHAPQGPRRSTGISDRHILVPYLWIRPISSWVRFGVKNQKKVDNAVVFGLRGMHNHTHLGHVMGYVVIGDIFRWYSFGLPLAGSIPAQSICFFYSLQSGAISLAESRTALIGGSFSAGV